MYIYRVLNENDILANPTENGIYAKWLYKEALNYGLEFTSDMDRLQILKSLSIQKQKYVNDIIQKKNVNDFKEILQERNGHIIRGSNTSTKFISFSTDLNLIRKFYLEQKKNAVAVVKSSIADNNLIDRCDNDFLIASDLSSAEKIKSNFFINKDGSITKPGSSLFNYLKSAKEVIYYNNVPKKMVITVLGPLEYELLYRKIFTLKYLNLCQIGRTSLIRKTLENIKKMIQNENDIYQYLYQEHYINNNSLKTLSEMSEYNKFELNEANDNVMKKVRKMW